MRHLGAGQRGAALSLQPLLTKMNEMGPRTGQSRVALCLARLQELRLIGRSGRGSGAGPGQAALQGPCSQQTVQHQQRLAGCLLTLCAAAVSLPASPSALYPDWHARLCEHTFKELV